MSRIKALAPLQAALAIFGLMFCSSGSKARQPQPPGPPSRCCITDPQRYYFTSRAEINHRFDLYRELGAGMLRCELGWRDVEQQPGVWDASRYTNYYQSATEHGFELKLIPGTIMSPPRWFFDAHPDARLMNEEGGFSYNTVSYWYPGLRKLIAAKTDGVFECLKRLGALRNTRFVVADFGPAGEPIYPAMWTLGPGFTHGSFFCYDPHAQQDFRNAMRKRYSAISAANGAWGTNYAAWDQLSVPRPGTCHGRRWEDLLSWYRDTKRDFIRWQVSNFQQHVRKYLGKQAAVIIYVPGADLKDNEWRRAIEDGGGDTSVKLMCDSRFLLDLASSKGCWLQVTGVDNRPEVEYLHKYRQEHHQLQTQMWGENAGDLGCARDPIALANTIIDNRLWGLDYTHSHFVFESDGLTPNERFGLLRQAYQLLHANPSR